eukprot:COSAG02_NODE_8853_length_2421_cov_2.423342_3_plen_91_part_00
MTSSRGSAPPPARQIACQLPLCLKPLLSKLWHAPWVFELDARGCVGWQTKDLMQAQQRLATLQEEMIEKDAAAAVKLSEAHSELEQVPLT